MTEFSLFFIFNKIYAFCHKYDPVRSPDGKLTLYCKGADTIIYERLSPACDTLKDKTTKHLNVSDMFVTLTLTSDLHDVHDEYLFKPTLSDLKQEYAGDGLRTLALAYKDLDDEYMKDWQQRHHEASTAMEGREEMLDELYEEIEKDMMVSGSYAQSINF